MTRLDPAPEARRLVEQARLDLLRSPAERNKLGQFATPPALALAIAEHAARLRESRGHPRRPVRFLDPSVGTGAFFQALRIAFPDDLIEQASGIELDPAFASVARSLWGEAGLEVSEGDFASIEPPPPDRRFTLILANPPYVRHHHLGPEAKRGLAGALGRRVGLKLNGLAGLYAYFLLLADAWMAEGGLGVWLVPSEFLDVVYGQGVRDYLLDRVTLLQIHRFRPADGQFGDALVTSAVVAFEKSPPPGSHRPLMTFGGTLTHPDRAEAVTIEALRASRKWSRFPLDVPEPLPAPRPRPTRGPRLGDLFTIKRGLVTGANGFFILPIDEALARGLPRFALKPILPGPRHLVDPVIEALPGRDPSTASPPWSWSTSTAPRPNSVATSPPWPTTWPRAGPGVSTRAISPADGPPGTPRSVGSRRCSSAPTWPGPGTRPRRSASSGTDPGPPPPTSTS